MLHREIANRLDGLTFQQGKTLQTGYEILHTFSHCSNHLPRFNRRARHRFSANAATEGSLPRGAGKIRDAAGPAGHLPAGEFTTDDFATRPVCQLSGQRRCAREQHRRRRRERAIDFGRPDQRQQNNHRLAAV